MKPISGFFVAALFKQAPTFLGLSSTLIVTVPAAPAFGLDFSFQPRARR